ncbi:MAG: hypothetical protein WC299_06350 [Kiritimatiellia bacterium]
MKAKGKKRKKHPCPDCRCCQWCADARCAVCRGWECRSRAAKSMR